MTTRENFTRTMVISCFSFTEMAQARREAMMKNGRLAADADLRRFATRVMPNYNVMGLAKAALEASSVRYLASDLRRRRAFASMRSRPGPVRTLAGAGISAKRALMFNFQKQPFAAAPFA